MTAAHEMNGKKYFTDIPALVTGGFEAAPGPGAGWFPFNYELDSFGGTGIATGAFSPAGELVLDLQLEGWHRLRGAHTPALRLWLDGEAGYVELPGNAYEISEFALPAADFTGRKLHIAPVRGTETSREVTLFFLSAEPCEPPSSHRNLIVTDDGHGVFCAGMDEPRDIYRHIYPFRDSDVFRMVWGVYGGSALSLHPDTKTAESPIRPESTYFYEHDWNFSRSLQRLRDLGCDPLSVVRDATRECGLELHYYIRMSAFYGPFPHIGWNTQIFLEHPEWRCCDEHGNSVNFMSYAFPQVQDYMLAYFDELLDYEPEGLCLAFNRGLPLMICEEPVIEAFQRKYGRTPNLPEAVDSPELQSVRHELLADFVARVQELAAKRGKVVSCIVPSDLEHNRLFGLDVALLVQRGLVESVMVGAGHGDNPALNDDLAPLQALKALGEKTGVRIYAGGSNAVHGMAWVTGDLQARARRMANILDAGLDGGWFWDAENIFNLNWEAMRRFGDREALDRIIRGEWPVRTEYDTKSIHDLVVGRYNPWHAY